MKNTQINHGYVYQQETMKPFIKLKDKTVSHHSHQMGLAGHEPLIIALDSMIRYARAYRMRFEENLSDDYFLGDHYLETIRGLRNLLNGDGALAMEMGITTDTKDNGCVESMFWSAMEIAGFKESDL